MTTRAKKRASEAYPFVDKCHEYDAESVKEARVYYVEGYDQAERDTIGRVSQWWKKRLVGFLSEGMADSIIKEFENEMSADDEQ